LLASAHGAKSRSVTSDHLDRRSFPIAKSVG
jgi:hypothetical protein